MQLRLAWLAGFWDGEGSIGLVKQKNTRVLNCQLSNTDYASVVEILSILDDAGISGRGYTYQERDPGKHQDAHYIRVGGINNILKFARLMCPLAVTKKRHWQIAIEWAEGRVALAGGVDAFGRLLRGGIQKDKGYSVKEVELAEELSLLNKRGPRGRDSKPEGRIVV